MTSPHDPWTNRLGPVRNQAYRPGAWQQPQDWEGFRSHEPTFVPSGTDGFAIAGLVLGIIPVLGGMLGIVFGLIGRSRTSRSGQDGKKMATTGAVLGAAWLTLIVVAGVIGFANSPEAGRSTAQHPAGDVRSQDLALGDCLTEIPDGTIETVAIGPCALSHKGEVFASFELPSGTFPGDVEVQRLGQGGCYKAISSFLGVPHGVDYGYELRYVSPSRGAWLQGERDITCLLFDPAGGELTGSARAGGALDQRT